MRQKLLISCSARKLLRPAPARVLYYGQMLRLGLRYAELHGMDALIYSAHYGWLHPDAWIKPYDATVSAPIPADAYPAGTGAYLGGPRYFGNAPPRFRRLLPYAPAQGYMKQVRLLCDALKTGVPF